MEPFIELLIWSVLLAFATAVLYRLLTKPAEMRRLKQDMNDLKDRANKATKSGDTKEATRLTTEMLKSNQAVFRMNMKPMMASMLLFIFVLGALAARFADMSIAAPFTIPFIGDSFNWFWWYFIVVIAGNFIFRKLLGVE
ncbi:MAG: DUF106 domain-containing protein [Candidatus Aenigmarchaeota archaeon]|nr:DUF106 domain-containing protein [Candidatus Aenigmarchaeota archaeon]